MNKLFFRIIPVLSVLVIFVFFHSCGDTPVETNSIKDTGASQVDGNTNAPMTKDPSANENEINGKDNRESGFETGITGENNQKSESETEPVQNDGWDFCTYATISSGVNVTILAGTNYTWNYSSVAAVRSPNNNRHHTILINDVPNGPYFNWTSSSCEMNYSHDKNSITGSFSLPPGNYTIKARLTYTINGTPYTIFSDPVYVNITAMNLPSAPYVSNSTFGNPPSRRPYLTWSASSPGVTNYVVQRRTYPAGQPPSGTFADYAVLSGSTLSFIDYNVTVVTHKYDLKYYAVEYRVRAVNPVGSSGYMNGAPMWYNHGCYSHTLGYICPLE